MKKILTILFLSILVSNIHAQCFDDRHSTVLSDHWVSCETSESPNPNRQASHWILYDLGDVYNINTSTIWNCNLYNNDRIGGIRNLSVDYSIDGQSWTSLGDFDLPPADASSYYEGTIGPNFNRKRMRFILLTANSLYDGECACLAEVKFNKSTPLSNVQFTVQFLNFSLYPNPADQFVNISIADNQSYGNILVEMVDINGQLILTQNWNSNSSNTLTLNTASIIPGEYVVKLSAGSRKGSRKLTIIHND